MDFIQPLIDWFVSNLERFMTWIHSMLIDVFNSIVEAVAGLIKAGASLLPDFTIPTVSSFASVSTTVGAEILGAINWFIPFDFIILLAGIWAASELIYIVSAPVLRWLKLVAR